ncbi:unnamed protein product [Adineta ricciae]|uniref:Uncharacterized protein n=1 Tax=Adineta ricciae TaxID=249248 RepID=A0A814CNV0_ADIRI|nr:unnamed protein product [Adineta ricciae]
MQRIQNIELVWLDSNVISDQSIAQLHNVVYNVHTYTNSEQCIEFMRSVKDCKVHLIISDRLAQHIVPDLHDIHALNIILIFCSNENYDEQWTTRWTKIKGIFADITKVCAALQQTIDQDEQNSLPMSFISVNQKLDQLDQTYIYTKILKELLAASQFEDKHMAQFSTYCRQLFVHNNVQLQNITEFEQSYYDKTPIWWYTHSSFLYSMVNHALRLMISDVIVRTGFFIAALHQHIDQLHKIQCTCQSSIVPFTVYCGHGLSKTKFEELVHSLHGFLSFNTFLLASKNSRPSHKFIETIVKDSDLIGIHFILHVDPTQTVTPFAFIGDISYSRDENEVLFSLHTIFRIDSIKQIDAADDNRLYEVNLMLTDSINEELYVSTDISKRESLSNTEAWYRLAEALLKNNQLRQAEEVYNSLLNSITIENEQAVIYIQLAWIQEKQEHYREAIHFYKKAIEIYERTLPYNHLTLVNLCKWIGSIAYNLEEYSEAFSLFKKILHIQQQSLAPDHIDLADTYNYIGNIYCKMNEYPDALAYHEKAYAVRQQSLPTIHSDLVLSLDNIGVLHYNMGNYSQALIYHHRSLAIQQQLPSLNQLGWSKSYDNIANVHYSMHDYAQALEFYKRALEIKQQSPSPTPIDLIRSFTNIGDTYDCMNRYSKALQSYEKALALQQQSFPTNYLDLSKSYYDIGRMQYKLDNNLQALSSFEKALKIQQQNLPSNHPDLITTYTSLADVYNSLTDYSKALSSYEKILEIQKRMSPCNPVEFSNTYVNIANTQLKMGDRSKALVSYQKVLILRRMALAKNSLDGHQACNHVVHPEDF